MVISKRGLSPVVATVLLIMLTMVLALMVFLWAQGFVSEQIQKGGTSSDQVCQQISFDVDSSQIANGVNLQIVNRGNTPIYNFDIKFVGTQDTSMKNFNFGVDVGQATPSQVVPVPSGITQLILYPMILGTVQGKKINKAVTCLNSGKTITLS